MIIEGGQVGGGSSGKERTFPPPTTDRGAQWAVEERTEQGVEWRLEVLHEALRQNGTVNQNNNGAGERTNTSKSGSKYYNYNVFTPLSFFLLLPSSFLLLSSCFFRVLNLEEDQEEQHEQQEIISVQNTLP